MVCRFVKRPLQSATCAGLRQHAKKRTSYKGGALSGFGTNWLSVLAVNQHVNRAFAAGRANSDNRYKQFRARHVIYPGEL